MTLSYYLINCSDQMFQSKKQLLEKQRPHFLVSNMKLTLVGNIEVFVLKSESHRAASKAT